MILCRPHQDVWITTYRPLEYERVYLPFGKVADTPFHIQVDDMFAELYNEYNNCPLSVLQGKAEKQKLLT